MPGPYSPLQGETRVHTRKPGKRSWLAEASAEKTSQLLV